MSEDLARLIRDYDAKLPPGDGIVEISAQAWAKWVAVAGKAPKPYQLGVIACSKSKMEVSEGGAVRARYLYNGHLFLKSLEVAERLCDHVIILSAKFGVVNPDQLIPWYEKKLPTTIPKNTQWALAVDQMLPNTVGKKVLCLAPEPYWLHLPSSKWEKPLRHLRIGEQKSRLKKMLIGLDASGVAA